jgi:hypothetical protein
MCKVYFVYLFWICPAAGCHASVSNPASPSPSPLLVMLPMHMQAAGKKERKRCTYGLSPTCAGRVAPDSRRCCIGRLQSAARRSLLMPCVRICSTWYGWMGQQRIRAHYIQLLVTSSCCSSSRPTVQTQSLPPPQGMAGSMVACHRVISALQEHAKARWRPGGPGPVS